jgi:integrase
MTVERVFTDDRWQECAECYLQSVYSRSGSKASLKTYGDELKTFFHDKTKDPASYTRSDIIRRMQAPSQSPRSRGMPPTGATQNHRLALLRSWFTWASTWIPQGESVPLFNKALPTNGIKRLKENVVYKSLSTDELRAFFYAIDEASVEPATAARNRALFTTALLTALRRQELLNIRFGDIAPATFREHGLVRQGFVVKYFSKGKSRVQSTRELPPAAMAAIMHSLEISGRLETIKSDSYIFQSVRPGQGIRDPNVDHNRPLSGDYCNHICKGIARIANIAHWQDCSMHSFRHSSAAQRLAAGSSLQEISTALGHSDLATTSRYLTALSGSEDSGALAIEKRLSWLTR